MMAVGNIGLKQFCMFGRKSGAISSDVVRSAKNESVSRKMDSEW